ncbi:ferredoxin [Actinophytocola sp.]|uniref:ferredoxin n=1 Tax=Actinophytocola sp. TaxID=1872138 RepID=UPI003D6B16C4
MLRITADLGLCEGYANCMIAAPEVFTVDDADGVVVLLQEQVSESQRAEVLQAVESCPVRALAVAERQP